MRSHWPFIGSAVPELDVGTAKPTPVGLFFTSFCVVWQNQDALWLVLHDKTVVEVVLTVLVLGALWFAWSKIINEGVWGCSALLLSGVQARGPSWHSLGRVVEDAKGDRVLLSVGLCTPTGCWHVRDSLNICGNTGVAQGRGPPPLDPGRLCPKVVCLEEMEEARVDHKSGHLDIVNVSCP